MDIILQNRISVGWCKPCITYIRDLGRNILHELPKLSHQFPLTLFSLHPWNSNIKLLKCATGSNNFKAVELASSMPPRVRRKFTLNFDTTYLQTSDAKDKGFVRLFVFFVFSRYVSPAYDALNPLCNAFELIFKTERLVSLATCLGTWLVVDTTGEDLKFCNADSSMFRII